MQAPARAVLTAALVALCLTFGCSRGTEKQPDVLLLVVDTLRADHLGSYGSTLGLTPHLDRLAAGAVVFANTMAQGPNTINSSPSLLASVFPSEHGYTNYKVAVAGEHVTLAEILAADGYETFAVSTNPHVTIRNGLAQGFETFVDNTTWTHTDAHTVDRIFFDWLDGRESERPFFAMLWYIEPHTPYAPRQDYVDRHVPAELRHLVGERTQRPGSKALSEDEKTVTRGLYRGEVHYYDDQFGQFVEELRTRGIFEDSLIVFTSDHGESFWEHTGVDGQPVVGHGASLYREETAVPLILKLPRGRHAGRVEARADSIDVLPTVIDLAGVEAAPELLRRVRGTSLVPLLEGRGRELSVHDSVSELITDHRGEISMKLQSLETDQGKIVITHTYKKTSYDPPLVQLLDVADREQEIPAQDGPAARLKTDLLRRFQRWRASLEPLPPRPIDPGERHDELKERLEALGYVN